MNNRKRDFTAVRMAATLLIMTITLVISGCGSNNDEEVYEAAATESTETESTTQNDSGEASEYWWRDYNKIVPEELYNDLDEASQKMVDDYAENVYVEMESFEEKSLQETEFDLTYVYDSDGLDKVLGNSKEDVTYDDIRAAIDRLDTSAKVKEIYTTLADNLEKQYPSMDLRVWLKNLETMKINFVSKEFFEMKGIDSGVYEIDSNQIFLRDDLEDMELTQDALEYQIIVHEMTHPLKMGNFKIDDTYYRSQFSTSPTNYHYADEALNSILALRSYDQESTLIGYLLISHMYEVMIENMDNYSMQDYIDEDVSYLITKLNETNGDDQAIRMVNLIELWYKDKKDDTTYIPPSFYYDLYDYIARMYYRNHITKDMTSEEIEKVKDSILFDQNCILDISRIKSGETKALIMGLMVYILNEYRVDQKTTNNSGLKHITVLEEAHNLLKNTSGGGESDLVGKSVEMITQTIAEIRTYGEGFIIVDQSPSSVDIAAIKNTNTKIVLRTPEGNDREAVGRSMGLTQEQVNEIAKLPSGVAVVYQNDWVRPILARINKANIKERRYEPTTKTVIRPVQSARAMIIRMLMQPWMPGQKIPAETLYDSLKVLDLARKDRSAIANLISDYDLFGGNLIWPSRKIPELQHLVRAVLELKDQDIMSCETPADLYRLVQSRAKHLKRNAVNEICFVLTMSTEDNGGN